MASATPPVETNGAPILGALPDIRTRPFSRIKGSRRRTVPTQSMAAPELGRSPGGSVDQAPSLAGCTSATQHVALEG
jgi:hypothetical protein